jgi:hypothetical protein
MRDADPLEGIERGASVIVLMKALLRAGRFR